MKSGPILTLAALLAATGVLLAGSDPPDSAKRALRASGPSAASVPPPARALPQSATIAPAGNAVPTENPAPPATPVPNAQPASKPAAAPAPGPAAAVVPKPPSAAPAPASGPATEDAGSILRGARERLTDPHVQSIKARIVERISIQGRRFQAEGTYLQGTDLRLKLEFKIPPSVAEQQGFSGSFLEVCDGFILWTRHEIGNKVRLTRRDVRQILNASKPGSPANVLAVEFGLGGLPALLASLERSMKFSGLSTQEIKGRKFRVIVGEWTDETQKRLKASNFDKKLLPSHAPDSVQIYFDPEILFPRRIAFFKSRPKQEPEQMVVMDFFDIVINAPVGPHDFEFTQPEGVPTVDVTNHYLQQFPQAPAK